MHMAIGASLAIITLVFVGITVFFGLLEMVFKTVYEVTSFLLKVNERISGSKVYAFEIIKPNPKNKIISHRKK